MNSTIIGALIVAGATMLGNIAAVLLLAYRVGRLTGTTEARITHGEGDRSRIWQAVGALTSKLDRHLERSHGN